MSAAFEPAGERDQEISDATLDRVVALILRAEAEDADRKVAS